MPIAETIYLLCAAASLVAAGLLLRQYIWTRSPMLLWSVVGFLGLAANNVLVYIDLVVVPSIDLSVARSSCAVAGLFALLYGLVWEADK
jgi:hypothetical protein